MRWIRQVLIVARNTFSVFTGDPLIFIINLFVIFATILIACLPGFTFGEQLRLVRDEVLALTFICCGIAATIGASNTISDDINRGMVPVLMSRPLSASAFVWGKWLGIICGLVILIISSATAFLWTSRIISTEHFIETLGVSIYIIIVVLTLLFMTIKHYLFRGAFIFQANLVVTASFLLTFLIFNFWGYNGAAQAQYGSLVNWSTILAYFFIFMALMIFAAIQSWLAVVYDQGILMGAAVVIFFSGLFLEYILSFVPIMAVQVMIQVFLPNWQTYWIADLVADNLGISWWFIGACMFHAIAQSTIFLMFASWIFKRQEYQSSI